MGNRPVDGENKLLRNPLREKKRAYYRKRPLKKRGQVHVRQVAQGQIF